MTSNNSVPIYNRSHARRVNGGKQRLLGGFHFLGKSVQSAAQNLLSSN